MAIKGKKKSKDPDGKMAVMMEAKSRMSQPGASKIKVKKKE